MNDPDLFIGMISGTSRDGADAALVRFPGGQSELLDALCLPYPPALTDELARLSRAGRPPREAEAAALNASLAGHFAEAAKLLLERAGPHAGSVRAIGSHGQTVWHEPEGPNPCSIQLGAPARIAQLTGIVTVGDFRSADIAAGGQGAPLAPLLHRALFRPERGRRVVLNLGGIANVSIIEADGSVTGFDTGPANCLMDNWIAQHHGKPFDPAGDWARSGQVDEGLLGALLTDPYFSRRPPKSTGTEYFNLAWLESRVGSPRAELADVQSTLAELSAITICDAIRGAAPADVLACGGGVHNEFLMERIRANLPGVPVHSTDSAGLQPDWVEAVLFAWLARERLARRRQDTRGITGASEPVLLGEIFDPPAV